MYRKMLALQEKKRNVAIRSRSRGEDVPDMSEWGSAMTPIGRLTDTGSLELDKDLTAKLRKLNRKQALD